MVDCAGLTKDQQKKLEEMMKKRVKSQECPFKKTCEYRVLEEEAELLCKDQETSQEAIMIHMYGRHTWETCPVFKETKREREGKYPREY